MLTVISVLKSFDADKHNIDDLVSLSSDAKALRTEYEVHSLEVPAWLTDAQREITREINGRMEDSRAKRRAEINAQLSRLKTRDERKLDLEAELAKISAEPVGAVK